MCIDFKLQFNTVVNMKSTIYSVLDRLIQKPVSMEFDEETLKTLTHGDLVIYKDSDNKEHV